MNNKFLALMLWSLFLTSCGLKKPLEAPKSEPIVEDCCASHNTKK